MVILGDMKELGSASHEAHCKVIGQALTCGADKVWFVGEEFRKALDTTPATSVEVRCFEDVEAVKAAITSEPLTNHLILIKGSNSTKLHQLPDLL